MLAKVLTCAVVGLEGALVEVEVDIGPGLPAFTIVGLPDAAVQVGEGGIEQPSRTRARIPSAQDHRQPRTRRSQERGAVLANRYTWVPFNAAFRRVSGGLTEHGTGARVLPDVRLESVVGALVCNSDRYGGGRRCLRSRSTHLPTSLSRSATP